MSSCFHNKIAHSLALKKKRNCSGFGHKNRARASSKPAKGNVYMLEVLGLLLHRRNSDVFGLTKGNRGVRQAQVLKVQKGVEVSVHQKEKNVQSG